MARGRSIPWTDAEIDLLYFAHEHGIVVKAVADLLHRSRFSVHRKNCLLQLDSPRRCTSTSGEWTLDKIREHYGGAAVERFKAAMYSQGLHPTGELPDDEDLCARYGCYRPRYGAPRQYFGLCLGHHNQFFGAP